MYIVPYDGYVYMSAAANSSICVYIYGGGKNLTIRTNGTNNESGSQAIYVKKGMRVQLRDTTGTTYFQYYGFT